MVDWDGKAAVKLKDQERVGNSAETKNNMMRKNTECNAQKMIMRERVLLSSDARRCGQQCRDDCQWDAETHRMQQVMRCGAHSKWISEEMVRFSSITVDTRATVQSWWIFWSEKARDAVPRTNDDLWKRGRDTHLRRKLGVEKRVEQINTIDQTFFEKCEEEGAVSVDESWKCVNVTRKKALLHKNEKCWRGEQELIFSNLGCRECRGGRYYYVNERFVPDEGLIVMVTFAAKHRLR